MDITELAERLRAFVAERDWNQFEDPKNLSMALAAEAGELLEVFQWKTTDEIRAGLNEKELAAASDEIADVFIYLVRLADHLDLDLLAVAEKKVDANADRYRIDVSRGIARKHRAETSPD